MRRPGVQLVLDQPRRLPRLLGPDDRLVLGRHGDDQVVARDEGVHRVHRQRRRGVDQDDVVVVAGPQRLAQPQDVGGPRELAGGLGERQRRADQVETRSPSGPGTPGRRPVALSRPRLECSSGGSVLPSIRVRNPWGSKSTTSTLNPWCPRAAARWIEEVVLPVPAFVVGDGEDRHSGWGGARGEDSRGTGPALDGGPSWPGPARAAAGPSPRSARARLRRLADARVLEGERPRRGLRAFHVGDVGRGHPLPRGRPVGLGGRTAPEAPGLPSQRSSSRSLTVLKGGASASSRGGVARGATLRPV